MQKKIIAVFGGSFNPPIISHFLLAKEILKKCIKVEKIIFVPVSIKYNKNGLIENKYRYEMLKLGCKNEPNLEVLDIELKNNVQLSTLDTLNKIKEMYEDKEIYFIIGTDNLKQLKTWNKAEELVKKYKFFVLQRDNDIVEEIIEQDMFLKQNKQAFINLKNIEKIDLSSTMVREKIQKGENTKGLIPDEIEKYIKENKLYRE